MGKKPRNSKPVMNQAPKEKDAPKEWVVYSGVAWSTAQHNRFEISFEPTYGSNPVTLRDAKRLANGLRSAHIKLVNVITGECLVPVH